MRIWCDEVECRHNSGHDCLLDEIELKGRVFSPERDGYGVCCMDYKDGSEDEEE